jgi:hypothetical protein
MEKIFRILKEKFEIRILIYLDLRERMKKMFKKRKCIIQFVGKRYKLQFIFTLILMI